MNYRVHLYAESIDSLPQGLILGSETASTVSSRGVYKFPVEVSNENVYPDGQCSSYDTEYCSWSNIPDDDFAAQDDLDYTIGQFVWTGFDYLGEPTPYDTYWPSRSSYFGICDLAGLPKDRFFLYRSQWNADAHTVHLLP
ncbi:MAG: beta-galactosidase, partial [Bacteroidales bacterium]|nr:beta-galactosidase [Bacteroidales bacterium]